MSASTATGEAAPTTAFRSFVWRRLGTILALAPLGVWVVIHVWNNLAAFRGAEAWQESVTNHRHPIAAAITWVVVLTPLAIHTLWGLGRLKTSQPNNMAYGYFGNLRYLLQRISALGVLGFVAAHLWLAFLQPRFVHGHPERFADIAREMAHHMPTLVVYLLGTMGVAYHLANGVATSAMAFGVGTTARSQKRMERVALVLFVVLLALSWGAIYGLWQAGGAAA
ncbi:MAG: succinate dehydrogenase [Deltaproteobacteria bacterium]|nr:succinate dehydrogenase [Deltaproteobacteria bacterium]